MIGNCLYFSIIYKIRYKNVKLHVNFYLIEIFKHKYMSVGEFLDINFRYLRLVKSQGGLFLLFIPHFYVSKYQQEISFGFLENNKADTIIIGLLYRNIKIIRRPRLIENEFGTDFYLDSIEL